MNEQEFFALKRQTLGSFEKLDEHLYLMNFTVPYGMDYSRVYKLWINEPGKVERSK